MSADYRIFNDLFSGHAELYARVRPQYPQQIYQHLAEIADCLDKAWDSGTGNGQAAISLAKIFNEVYATDASASQIKHAIHHPRVKYSVKTSENTDYPNLFFDCITAVQAIHWYDLHNFYVEVDRVLKPGGLLCVWGYAWFIIAPEIDNVFSQTILKPIESYWAPETKLLHDEYIYLQLPYESIEVPVFEILESWNLIQLIGYLQSWSPMAAYRKDHGVSGVNELFSQLINVWGDINNVREIRMPIHMKICRKPGK